MDFNEEETEETEEIDDSWWDRMEAELAKRTWLENTYWWCKRHIRDSYWWFRNSPRRIHQYFYRGFSDRQLWSLDCTIAKFVAPRLKRLKEIQHGHPVIEADEQLCLGCWSYPEMWNRENCHWDPTGFYHLDSEQIWDEYMDKMIYAMDSIAKNGDWDPPMDDIESSDIRDGNVKWEAYFKERDEHWKRLKEGIKLFGEFFGALWD